MNRYALITKGRPVAEMEILARQYGGRDIRYAPRLGQVFCTLDPSSAKRLAELPGMVVKLIKRVSTKYTDALQISAPDKLLVPRQGEIGEVQSTYGALVGSTAPYWYQVCTSFAPPINGYGGTCAILDSGIRKTHRGLKGKVLYEKNFSDAPSADDVFDHGTGVAYALSGGKVAEYEDQGISPGVYLMNIKVLDDDGEGSEENVILGLEEVIRLVDEAYVKGAGRPLLDIWTDPETITAVNISFGAPDDGDPDDPLRVACRNVIAAHEEEAGWRMPVVAAAGNGGPGAQTIVSPACDPEVWAVGAANVSPFGISEYSSRGPTREGHVKPDIVFYGSNINLASSKSDDSYVVKSGTSFAAPFAVGAGFDLWEILRKEDPEAGASLSMEQFLDVISSVAVKPEGAPEEKDNTYGHGLPSGGRLAELYGAGEVPALITSGITEIAVPLMSLGLMGMMMAGMNKSFTR
jgi:serine protease AprX